MNASIDGTKQKRHVIVVGFPGAGKSMLANCLFNRRGTLYHVKHYPLPTSFSLYACSVKPTIISNDEFVIVDTVGFGDWHFNQTSVIEEFKQGLALLDNKVDLVLFVMKLDRIGDYVADFFQILHKELFRNYIHNNSVLVCSECRKGWLAANRGKNEPLNRVLNMCSNRGVELQLDFNIPDVEMQLHERDFFESYNERSRQKEIDALIAYLNGLSGLRRVDLSEFFKEHISLKLIEENGAELARTSLWQSFFDTLVNRINGKSPHSVKAKALDKKCLVSFQLEVASDAN